MYSPDINFIKDRPEYKLNASSRLAKLRVLAGDLTPLYLGLAVGLISPVVVGVGWLYLQSQNTQLEQQIAQLDAQLNRLGTQEQEIKQIQDQTSQIKADTQALAAVFNQIRPWSAMLQDIRDRIPTTVQIETIRQTGATATSPTNPSPAAGGANPTPQPSPSPTSGATATSPTSPSPTNGATATSQPAAPGDGIEITGIARSFNDVNDFLLTLQQSAFFAAKDTKIVTAELADNPIAVSVPTSQSATVVQVKLPQVVRYTIQSSLSDVPASELVRELERQGTLGLVTRIRVLQKKGIIQ